MTIRNSEFQPILMLDISSEVARSMANGIYERKVFLLPTLGPHSQKRTYAITIPNRCEPIVMFDILLAKAADQRQTARAKKKKLTSLESSWNFNRQSVPAFCARKYENARCRWIELARSL